MRSTAFAICLITLLCGATARAEDPAAQADRQCLDDWDRPAPAAIKAWPPDDLPVVVDLSPIIGFVRDPWGGQHVIVGMVSIHVPTEPDARDVEGVRREIETIIEREWAAAGWDGICSIQAQARSLERIRARVSGLLKPTRVFVLMYQRTSVPVP